MARPLSVMETTFQEFNQDAASAEKPVATWTQIQSPPLYTYQLELDGVEEPQVLRIFKTGFENLYTVVSEDGYDNAYAETLYLSRNEIEQRYDIKLPTNQSDDELDDIDLFADDFFQMESHDLADETYVEDDGVEVDPHGVRLVPFDIYAKKGTLVMVTEKSARNGYDSDKRNVQEHIHVGKIYTVDHTLVSGWSTDVFLVEIPNKPFNSVSFKQLA